MTKTETAKRLIAIAAGAAVMGFFAQRLQYRQRLGRRWRGRYQHSLENDPGHRPRSVGAADQHSAFALGTERTGIRSLVFTIYGTVCLSLSLWLFNDVRYKMDDLLLASLYAGLFLGLGLGLIFRYGGTTGGADIVSRIVHKRTGTSTERQCSTPTWRCWSPPRSFYRYRR